MDQEKFYEIEKKHDSLVKQTKWLGLTILLSVFIAVFLITQASRTGVMLFAYIGFGFAFAGFIADTVLVCNILLTILSLYILNTRAKYNIPEMPEDDDED